ncbi:MAG TPA: hypothetical protein DIC64_01710 [Alphaproteobacteria bacterium]|nr:hypothetical protein [Alphaproteobacteria bacterium]
MSFQGFIKSDFAGFSSDKAKTAPFGTVFKNGADSKNWTYDPACLQHFASVVVTFLARWQTARIADENNI